MKTREFPSRTSDLPGLTAIFALALISSVATAQTAVAQNAAAAVPLKVGVHAPNAKLRTADGKATDLRAVLKGKPTVLIFYRGGWCPYCNVHLADLATVEGQLHDLGYQIVAITPDTPEEISKTIGKHQLTYQVLSDSKAVSLQRFGVAYRLDDATYGKMKDSYHVDLETYSGEMHHILPVPSVFLIDAKGKIVYVHSNPDYKVRMKGAEIVAAAKEAH